MSSSIAISFVTATIIAVSIGNTKIISIIIGAATSIAILTNNIVPTSACGPKLHFCASLFLDHQKIHKTLIVAYQEAD